MKNARVLPKVYYGLHFTEGVAEYRESGKEPFRIFIGENTIKNMAPTFEGRPVYVHHVDEVDMENLQEEADGYVVESFFNKSDGKHWVKFIVVSDKGHAAIRNGWKLSNAYHIKSATVGGLWHGVDYDQEVVKGEYEHLAIVQNPRYAESVIFTPEEFKKYNSEKEVELYKLANSQEDISMFKFFKKSKIENEKEKELESMSVLLPKSKVEMTLTQVINAADEAEVDKAKTDRMANGADLVQVGDEKIKVDDLVTKYLQNKKSCNQDEEEKKENEDDEEKKENEDDEDKKENEDDDKDKKENQDEDKEEVEKKSNKKKNTLDQETKKKNFEKLKNAPDFFNNGPNIDLAEDKIARGKARYGS